MTSTRVEESLALLRRAAATARLPVLDAEPIRLAENDLWRLPNHVVARIARAGQDAAAAREVAVTRWLAEQGLRAVRPLPIDQPVQVGDRCVTFWEELPAHRPGSVAELAQLLRQLHRLPLPSFPLGPLAPFIRLSDRIKASRIISDEDRQWLLRRLESLQGEWRHLPPGLPECVTHGDAWGGNVAVSNDSGTPYLLDFERTSVGPPEWDLTSTAVSYETTGTRSKAEYVRFCELYGVDVMSWPGYPTLRAIRELRMTTFALQVADHDPTAVENARHRLACLRGLRGPRPWGWQPAG
ncbi:phosphotransferase family protein [Streptomyces millisiae]|uniref:Aminoglycoside phosphotransferase family protein n=1 Tax=Streptomyces millisiae TaxID=3075542 RepID=A0ABU2LWF5_9ACTN|nr:aminoglycoside phosphotransferase family protein [Streptomyces sp. DSM 44918]MDT0321899.1 aminoglycoside phosphotransferase family protein [Streptomyces sp. DSM 44918]